MSAERRHPAVPASDALQLAALAFAVDRVSAEVILALRRAAVPSILIKGPAIVTWLYPDDGSRLYGDTDLLLRKADWAAAIAVLEGLGFEDDLGPLAHPRMESGAGYSWGRPADGSSVDLHQTLFGIGADPELVWEEFSAAAIPASIGGTEVLMPPYPARLLHVVLHAVQHGGEALPKTMLDLERALARASRPQWLEARALARRLRAEDGFAAGLRLTAAGRRLATEIGARGGSPAAGLRLEWKPLAEGFQELAETAGLRRKAALLLRELFPNPAFMRWWTPLARRGPIGLAAAYPWRLVWLAYRALPGYRAWRRATRGGPAR